jgi:hypothetical protein
VKRPNNEALGIGEQGTAKKGEQKIIVLGQLFICYGPCNTLICASVLGHLSTTRFTATETGM